MSKSGKDNGGAAFACAAHNGHQEGMSLRDYMAGQALAGTIAFYGVGDVEQFGESKAYKSCAKNAYDIADAMIAERNKDAS